MNIRYRFEQSSSEHLDDFSRFGVAKLQADRWITNILAVDENGGRVDLIVDDYRKNPGSCNLDASSHNVTGLAVIDNLNRRISREIRRYLKIDLVRSTY